MGRLSEVERRGLWFAAIAMVVFVGLLAWGTIPADGFLRDARTGSLLRSPFLRGIVALIFAGGVLSGIAYGLGARTLGGSGDIVKWMAKSMETLGAYLVLVFFAAQFVAFFNWTNLGLIGAVRGAELLKASGFNGAPLVLSFVAVAALANLLISSASAKWAILAPIFVPMFMLLGLTPEIAQCAYRVGDSVTNIITPMMSYFPLMVAFAARYDKKAGLGTIVSLMLPYSAAFFVGWLLLLAAWVALGLAIGPGAGVWLAR